MHTCNMAFDNTSNQLELHTLTETVNLIFFIHI